MVDIKQEPLSPVTQPQNNAGMQPTLSYGGPQPQSPVVQPQSPVIGGSQPQSPVAISNVQPQAVAPMQVYSKVYGDHGANNRQFGRDGKRNWTFGLLDCSGRCGLCCCAYWCPCVVFSKTRQRMRSMQYEGRVLEGGGDKCTNHCLIYFATMFTGHSWCLQLQPRVEIRERYAIRGNLVKDWLSSALCTACALTQERREIELEELSYRQQVVQVDGEK
ncbi:PLAC8 family-domain-containing protein [Russula emetica]|nr:PLAC8 family-domain-containing protein [Russula emetica]